MLDASGYSSGISQAGLRVPESMVLVPSDMIALGVRLSDAGVGDYWDDVDAVARNQLIEQQLTDAAALERIAAQFQDQPDPAEAETMPGVRCVLRYDDPDLAQGVAVSGHELNAVLALPPRAVFQGEVCGAFVVADSEEFAENALKTIMVQWEQRPFILIEPIDNPYTNTALWLEGVGQLFVAFTLSQLAGLSQRVLFALHFAKG